MPSCLQTSRLESSFLRSLQSLCYASLSCFCLAGFPGLSHFRLLPLVPVQKKESKTCQLSVFCGALNSKSSVLFASIRHETCSEVGPKWFVLLPFCPWWPTKTCNRIGAEGLASLSTKFQTFVTLSTTWSTSCSGGGWLQRRHIVLEENRGSVPCVWTPTGYRASGSAMLTGAFCHLFTWHSFDFLMSPDVTSHRYPCIHTW